jgi:hypothetical protein
MWFVITCQYLLVPDGGGESLDLLWDAPPTFNLSNLGFTLLMLCDEKPDHLLYGALVPGHAT